jgi:hypothetical protein
MPGDFYHAFVGATREREQVSIVIDFQAVARDSGFVTLEESGDETIMWLRKKASVTDTSADQRMCTDSLTNSATIFWTTLQGRLNSKTFRGVLALQQWLHPKLESEEGR